MERDEVLRRVTDAVTARQLGHPLRLGVDGVCGAGKTTFATALAARLAQTGRPVIRLDPDGFHNVRAVRYRQGRDSAQGYYEDAFDFESLRRLTLEPLGPGGTRRYASRVHDLESDEVLPVWSDAPVDAIVVFDATFLQRDELRAQWDEVIFLDVARDIAVARGVRRDADRLGGEDATRAAYESRYMAACDLYVAEQDPRSRAGIVIDNTDPLDPAFVAGL